MQAQPLKVMCMVSQAQGMTALHYTAACGSVNLLMNILQQCDAELVDKPNKVSLKKYLLKRLQLTQIFPRLHANSSERRCLTLLFFTRSQRFWSWSKIGEKEIPLLHPTTMMKTRT